MIVTRQMAEQAALTLGFCHINGESQLTRLDAQVVQKAYRNLAKLLHPDTGEAANADRFVSVDRAKCVLLEWFKRKTFPPSDPSIAIEKCVACKGTGRRTLTRGFRSMTMVCGNCRGTGERLPPEKVEE